jgi:hypothetical protein
MDVGGLRAAHFSRFYMSVIYLIHPKHGAKVAISEAEAISDAMNGWSRYTPDTPSSAAVEPAAAPVVNTLAAPRRRGRPRPETKD